MKTLTNILANVLIGVPYTIIRVLSILVLYPAVAYMKPSPARVKAFKALRFFDGVYYNFTR